MPKIATFKNFSGMEENGLYYVENFIPKKVGGRSLLSPGYGNYFTGSETQFSGLEDTIYSMTQFDFGGSFDVLAKDSSGNIYRLDLLNFGTNSKKVHSVTNSGIILQLGIGDVFLTKNNNLLYPTAGTLGIGYIGQCKAGSGTTKIIDTSGRNFTTLGISTSTGYNRVYNVTTGEEHTITSVSTTNTANDTLNFTAGAFGNSTNDYFIAFADGGKDNGGNKWNFFKTTAYPQYPGQENEITSSNFLRQIRQFDTDYLILNGNFLAALNVDETTWNDNFKQLPAQTLGTCLETNQGRILIGCSYKGKGRLLLWDGFTDGFLSQIETERPITAIAPYDSNFIFVMGNALFVTNGYSYKKLTELPDTSLQNSITERYGQLKVVNDNIFLMANGDDVNRTGSAAYVYIVGKGWIKMPFSNSTTNFSYVENARAGIFTFDDSGIYRVFFSFSGDGTNGTVISQLSWAYSQRAILAHRVQFDENVNVRMIKLHIAPHHLMDRADLNNTNITVNVGDGKGFWQARTQARTGSTTTTLNIPLANYPDQAGVVGQEILIAEGDAGGERTYIESISNPGTVNEVWTVSPALSSAPANGTEVRMFRLKKTKTYTVGTDNIPDVLTFDVSGIYTDELLFEVIFDGETTSAARIDLLGIDIYD